MMLRYWGRGPNGEVLFENTVAADPLPTLEEIRAHAPAGVEIVDSDVEPPPPRRARSVAAIQVAAIHTPRRRWWPFGGPR